MKKIEVTFVGNRPEPVRADGLTPADFEVYDTGKAHPDPEYSQYTELVVYYKGEPVQYLYEGNLETLSAYSQESLVALRNQLLGFFVFDPVKRLFRD